MLWIQWTPNHRTKHLVKSIIQKSETSHIVARQNQFGNSRQLKLDHIAINLWSTDKILHWYVPWRLMRSKVRFQLHTVCGVLDFYLFPPWLGANWRQVSQQWFSREQRNNISMNGSRKIALNEKRMIQQRPSSVAQFKWLFGFSEPKAFVPQSPKQRSLEWLVPSLQRGLKVLVLGCGSSYSWRLKGIQLAQTLEDIVHMIFESRCFTCLSLPSKTKSFGRDGNRFRQYVPPNLNRQNNPHLYRRRVLNSKSWSTE